MVAGYWILDTGLLGLPSRHGRKRKRKPIDCTFPRPVTRNKEWHACTGGRRETGKWLTESLGRLQTTPESRVQTCRRRYQLFPSFLVLHFAGGVRLSPPVPGKKSGTNQPAHGTNFPVPPRLSGKAAAVRVTRGRDLEGRSIFEVFCEQQEGYDSYLGTFIARPLHGA